MVSATPNTSPQAPDVEQPQPLDSPSGPEPPSSLPNFRGSLAWIHDNWESHKGYPYWPDGDSGVTLDPGLDLGHAEPQLIFDTYRWLFTDPQAEAVRSVLGIKGKAAKVALDESPELQSIRISRSIATAALAQIARPDWLRICQRFPVLLEDGVPEEVHTAMLSIAYNRGRNNPALKVLAQPLAARDWRAVGTTIAAMQQDHELRGIRRRRRAEGALVLEVVAV